MKQNKSRLTKLIVIFIIVFVLLVLKNELPGLLTEKSDRPFSHLKKDDVTEIIILKDEKHQLYRKGSDWYVKKDNHQFPADQESVTKILDGLINLTKDNPVSNNRSKHQGLGIGNRKIEFKTGSKTYAVYLGNPTGLANNYVRIDDENEIFITGGFNEITSAADFRDLSLNLITDEAKVSSINIAGLPLEKTGNEWKVNSDTVKKDRVDFYLNDLKTLKASDIAPKTAMLPELMPFTIKVTENKKTKNIDFYYRDENSYLAKTSYTEYVYTIPAAYVASLKKESKDFIE